MPRKVCNEPGCPTITTKAKCDEHTRQRERDRGSSTQRGYGRAHRLVFREGVLAKHPICQRCHRAPSTVADHHPLSKRELDDAGMDSNDPAHGRGLCHACHSIETAEHQPGGWHIAPRD